ncbi:MAG: (d)CMP kinase [Saprospiraceae bacterium]|nr:(d)CMP kinase [Bacteroidia bacterium]NNL91183.1 (d)CMP kinase [Saprospiraceae bacterium]
MNRKINIAIDGHSSCGKSTLAKQLAAALGYIYIDSGAMYRSVALYYIENEIDVKNKEAAVKALDEIQIDIKSVESQFRILLNGVDVTKRIIAIDVSSIVSEVAAISEVRRKLVAIQKQLGEEKGVVMDGRDIGTVVFPEAELKIFVTANIDVRTQRRFLELKEKGMSTSIDIVKENLEHRDHIDSTREDSPLMQADDAILIDNSYMRKDEQLYLVDKMAREFIASLD